MRWRWADRRRFLFHVKHCGTLVPILLGGVLPEQSLRKRRVLAVANQKGGVGKTTTAVNLGASLAELGYRTLVIDLDPQANATTGLGLDPRSIEISMYDVILREVPLEDCIEPTVVKNLFVAPVQPGSRRRRDRAGPGVLPGAPTRATRSRRSATSTTSSSSTARPRSGC